MHGGLRSPGVKQLRSLDTFAKAMVHIMYRRQHYIRT